MAVYTTFFAGSDGDLDAGFAGWRKPLAAPVKRTRLNPFTKQPVTYDSWEPEEDDAGDAAGLPRKIVTAMQGDYGAFLEARLPDRVRTLPHLAVKSVLSPHVDELLGLLTKESVERLRPARFVPRGDARGATLDLLPDAGVLELSRASDADLVAAAQRLLAEGWFADDGWPVDACEDLLRRLRGLAIQAMQTNRRVFLLTEP